MAGSSSRNERGCCCVRGGVFFFCVCVCVLRLRRLRSRSRSSNLSGLVSHFKKEASSCPPRNRLILHVASIGRKDQCLRALEEEQGRRTSAFPPSDLLLADAAAEIDRRRCRFGDADVLVAAAAWARFSPLISVLVDDGAGGGPLSPRAALLLREERR